MQTLRVSDRTDNEGLTVSLAVAAQKISVVHVDQRQLGRVVLDLQGNRSDIGSPDQGHRNLESRARSHRTGLCDKSKAHSAGRRRLGRGGGHGGSSICLGGLLSHLGYRCRSARLGALAGNGAHSGPCAGCRRCRCIYGRIGRGSGWRCARAIGGNAADFGNGGTNPICGAACKAREEWRNEANRGSRIACQRGCITDSSVARGGRGFQLSG